MFPFTANGLLGSVVVVTGGQAAPRVPDFMGTVPAAGDEAAGAAATVEEEEAAGAAATVEDEAGEAATEEDEAPAPPFPPFPPFPPLLPLPPAAAAAEVLAVAALDDDEDPAAFETGVAAAPLPLFAPGGMLVVMPSAIEFAAPFPFFGFGLGAFPLLADATTVNFVQSSCAPR